MIQDSEPPEILAHGFTITLAFVDMIDRKKQISVEITFSYLDSEFLIGCHANGKDGHHAEN
jgi:hypothetical protein